MDSEIRALYLVGLTDYDVVLESYRLRSSIVARLVNEQLGRESSPTSASDQIHARTSFLIWHIAQVELRLRGLIGDADWISASKSVRRPTSWAETSKELKREVADALSLGARQKTTVGTTIEKYLPAKESIYDALMRRTPSASAATPADELAKHLTLSEQVQLAVEMKVLPSRAKSPAERITRRRNDVAHFRALTHEELANAVRDCRDILTEIDEGLAEGDSSTSGA